ncbi:MAG: PSD1 and planctomycete cytochrome C domain-containing protein [Fuerstiella sp.]
MNCLHTILRCASLIGLCSFSQFGRSTSVADEISFQRQIRPILSDKCFQCHGPDAAERHAGLRLDEEASSKGELESGLVAIAPSSPASSEMIVRMLSTDEDLVMPPPHSGKSLTTDEIELLQRWVKQGAPWGQHWSFEPIQRSPVPSKPTSISVSAIANDIDRFIVAALSEKGLQPNQQANKAALLRRLSFDLTGLPPTMDQVRRFQADKSADAYEKVVNQLLASDQYGEHRSRYWLDAARYGDTHGLHLDNYREMWAYRDYVINSFNGNKPFDQFTVEQLAGDLLESPTDEQLIATGFNRCHVTTSEGGSIAEEVHSRNVVERVVATGTVFMGLTMDCTRCHDHKFDPLTQQDFYSLYAFFNNIDGKPLDGNKKDHAPVIKVWTDSDRQQHSNFEDQHAKLNAKLQQLYSDINYEEPANPRPPEKPPAVEFVWIDDEIPAATKAAGDQEWKFVKAPEPVLSGHASHVGQAKGLGQHLIQSAKTPLKIEAQDVLFSYVYLDPENPPTEIMLQWNDGSWDHRAYWGADRIDWGKNESASRRHMGPLPAVGQWVRLEVPAKHVGLKKGSKVGGWAFTQFGGKVYWDKSGKADTSSGTLLYDSFAQWRTDQSQQGGKSLPKDLRNLLKAPDLDDKQLTALRRHFFKTAYRKTRKQATELEAQLAAALQSIDKLTDGLPTTLIYRERSEVKPAYVLNRGEYDQPTDEVQRATPKVLPAIPTDRPMDRLALAQWLVSEQHPLMARVTVNRIWQQFFGTGLVKTSEDFGSQGEMPTHPELLDWLASEFRKPQLAGAQHDWDVKHIVKLIVMSAAYQQSAFIDPNELRIDPENRFLARGPRYRLDAEMLRDQALSVSGLLVEDVGGPSVKPPQPDGLWFAVGYSGSNTVRFKADNGSGKVHRRTLYTFVKRTAPPPQMSTFDAPSRESCTVRRERTNSPLQALLLMNDPQYVECARGLAIRTMNQAHLTTQQRASFLLQEVVLREVTPSEISALIEDYEFYRSDFASDEGRAAKLIAIGEQPAPQELNAVQLAAWTMVANLVLNLDEVVNK